MGYTNSPLVVYKKLSPNHSGQRTHSIDRITPHCVVGQLSAESEPSGKLQLRYRHGWPCITVCRGKEPQLVFVQQCQ